MKIACPEPARVGGRLMQAPASTPGSETWLASGMGPDPWMRFAAVATVALVAAMSLDAPKASVVRSARTSAVRSRGVEPRRRRVRCGTLRAFAIGPASLATRPPWGPYLMRAFTAWATFFEVGVSMLR